jgi:hypothetical protein
VSESQRNVEVVGARMILCPFSVGISGNSEPPRVWRVSRDVELKTKRLNLSRAESQ